MSVCFRLSKKYTILEKNRLRIYLEKMIFYRLRKSIHQPRNQNINLALILNQINPFDTFSVKLTAFLFDIHLSLKVLIKISLLR